MPPINRATRKPQPPTFRQRAIQTAKAVANRAAKNIAKEPAKKLKQAADTFVSVKEGIKDVKDNRQAVRDARATGLNRRQAILKTTRENFAKAGNPPTMKLNKLTAFKQASKGVDLVTNASQLKSTISTANRDIRQAIRSGSAADRDKAIGSTANATKTVLGTAKGGLELARDARKVGGTYRAASRAFANAAPDATRRARVRGSLAATRSAVAGETKRAATRAAREAVQRVASRRSSPLRSVVGGANNSAANRALKSSTKAAGKAATQAAARAGAGALAKTAGRFVPGANIAIAAADAATAYSTLRDPKASTTKKVTSVVTAIGSAAAATNIPVVSQAGAAVSAVSSFVGGIFG